MAARFIFWRRDLRVREEEGQGGVRGRRVKV